MDTLNILTALMNAGLRLIPLDHGSKATREPKWSEAGEKTITALARRAARYHHMTVPGVMQHLQLPPETHTMNWGVLNDASRVIIIDADDPKALPVLNHGLVLMGCTAARATEITSGGLRWKSVRGIKTMYRLPARTKADVQRSSAVVRRVNNGTHTTVFELRCTGQDAIPPSTRADANDFRLEWLDGGLKDGKIPEAPPELIALHRQLLDHKQNDIIKELEIKAGTPKHLVGKRAAHDDDYPGYLAGAAEHRRRFNAAITFEQILDQHPDYEPDGARWRYVPSGGTASISRPRSGTNEAYWQCWDTSCPLFGRSDAWRAFVELSHAGNLAAAKKDVDNTLPLAFEGAAKEPAKKPAKSPPKKAPIDTGSGKSGAEKNKKKTKPAGHSAWGNLPVLNDDDLKDPEPLIEGGLTVMPGTTLMIGKAKQGKTYNAMAISLMLADPSFTYMDSQSTTRKPQRVLIIGLDQHRDMYLQTLKTIYGKPYNQLPKDYIRLIAMGDNSPSAFDAFEQAIYPEVDPALVDDDDVIGALVQYAVRNEVKYVIIDNLFNIDMMIEDGARDPMRRQYQMTERIRAPMGAAGVSCMMLHWEGKGSKANAVDLALSDRAAGMQALTGGADHAIAITPIEGNFNNTVDPQTGLLRDVVIAIQSQGRGHAAQYAHVVKINRNQRTAHWLRGVEPSEYKGQQAAATVATYLANKGHTSEETAIPQADLFEATVAREGVSMYKFKADLRASPEIRNALGRGKKQGVYLSPECADKYRTEVNSKFRVIK